jgi:DNA-binding response OmpR family regulator
MQNKKIIIIEDDKVTNGFLRKALSEFYTSVESYYDGQSGLDAIHKEKPDLILLDLMMPGLNGFDVLKDLKANSPELLNHVIIMSNSSENNFVATALEYNVTSFVVKGDYDLVDIVEIIKKKLN